MAPLLTLMQARSLAWASVLMHLLVPEARRVTAVPVGGSKEMAAPDITAALAATLENMATVVPVVWALQEPQVSMDPTPPSQELQARPAALVVTVA